MKDEQDFTPELVVDKVPTALEQKFELPPLAKSAAANSRPLCELVPLSRWKIIKKSIPRASRMLLAAAMLLVLSCLVVFGFPDVAPGYAQSFLAQQEMAVALLCVVTVLWLISFPFYQYLYWRSYYYDVDDDTIRIRKGVIAKREAILPYSRITDVYLDRDIADVVFGLYDLHISTPTVESGKFAHIDGLRKDGAEKIRDLLLRKINATQPDIRPQANPSATAVAAGARSGIGGARPR